MSHPPEIVGTAITRAHGEATNQNVKPKHISVPLRNNEEIRKAAEREKPWSTREQQGRR